MKNSKKIEEYLIALLKGESIIDISEDPYLRNAKDMQEKIKNYGIKYVGNIYKPKVKSKPVYSTKGEPKTDISGMSNIGQINLSVKKDDTAYLVSCNSKEDFLSQLIYIHDGEEILNSNMIYLLKKSSDLIKKVPNFYSFDRSYIKNGVRDPESFVNDKFTPKATKKIGAEKAKIYAEYIIECYKNEDLQKQYHRYLKTSESYIQFVIGKLFSEYPEYTKKVLFEFVTGNIKFNNSNCSSNFLVDISGIYKLDSPDCEYINKIYNKFLTQPKIGRLQNVPRKKTPSGILKTGNLKLIAESFSVADLTFKL
jgi:hypothetical protein